MTTLLHLVYILVDELKGVGDFAEHIHLGLLEFHHVLLLAEQQVVDLIVEDTYFQLRFEVDHIIVFGPLAVFGFLPVLAHHDDRRLQGGQAGQDEVEQYEGVGIEAFVGQEVDVEPHPDADEGEEDDDECPAAAEVGDLIGQAFAIGGG